MIDALFRNGCDNGTVGRSEGVQFIIYDREVASFAKAAQIASTEHERLGRPVRTGITGLSASS